MQAMKKLIATFALMGCSFGLMAQDTLPLQTGQMLDATVISKVTLKEGQNRENLWFSVETNRVEGTSTHKLSNCTMTTDVNLKEGKMHLQSKQLRCISTTGEIFTDKNIQASLTASTSEVCTSGSGKCSEITLQPGSNYVFEIKNSSSLIAEFNPSREINLMRLQQDI